GVVHQMDHDLGLVLLEQTFDRLPQIVELPAKRDHHVADYFLACEPPRMMSQEPLTSRVSGHRAKRAGRRGCYPAYGRALAKNDVTLFPMHAKNELGIRAIDAVAHAAGVHKGCPPHNQRLSRHISLEAGLGRA